MRIVVTGASGNVGTALLMLLGAEGHQLVGISRRPPPMAAPYSGAEWHTVDVGAPHARTQLEDVFAGADAVVHLAWRLHARKQERAEMARTNRHGTCAVAEAARRAGVGHLVHMSSIGAYSPAPGLRVDESWPVRGIPTSAYSLDKAAAERTMSIYETELAVAVVRPAFILPGAALVPPALFRRAVVSRIPVPSALNTQVVHADAVADAVGRIVQQHATGAFNVAADPVISREAWRETFGGVGPDVSPHLLRRSVWASWRLRLHHAAPSWLDLALALPTLDCGRVRQLGWSTGNALQVLAAQVNARLRRFTSRRD